MDTIIEDKIIELVKGATMTDAETDIVVNVEDEVKDWNESSDYPSIVVGCFGWNPENFQVGALEKKYTVFVSILTMAETVKEAKRQRSVIHNRVDSVLRRNQQLTGLVDTTGKEHAFAMNVVEVRFAHAGFSGYIQAVANFRITVDTNTIGPF